MKETLIINIDRECIEEDKLKRAANILKGGGLVAFPTETVYGLGANGLDPRAVREIFRAKNRPIDNPLILHIGQLAHVEALVREIPQVGWSLMEEFWPGPLTLVMERADIVPDIISAGLPTVAIRMPSHPIARKLIQLADLPIAAPSANISGKPSPTRSEHVVEDLMGRVDAIIAGGSCEVGLESTVLDMTGEVPRILRPGAITRERLLELIPRLQGAKDLEGDNLPVAKSPGMKYSHYAPRAQVYIIRGDQEKTIRKIRQLSEKYHRKGKKVGIICFDESYASYGGQVVKSMGSRFKLESIAANLFKVLREFDGTDVEIILAESLEEVELGQAIMNRLIKAAGHNIIDL